MFLDTFFTLFIEHFQCSFHHSKIKFIIINLYEHLKIIEWNPQLNTVESFIPNYLQTFLHFFTGIVQVYYKISKLTI